MTQEERDKLFDALPLTQQLVLELLAARHRCGEEIWTFGSNCNPALRKLEALGYVGSKGGIVERTSLAWLTDLGREIVMSSDYVPPILRDRERAGA